MKRKHILCLIMLAIVACVFYITPLYGLSTMWMIGHLIHKH